MLLVPPPPVIVPLPIVHTYLSPAPPLPSIRVAIFPVEALQTATGVLILGSGHGSAVIGIWRFPIAWQPLLLVTVTVNPTEPEGPAVYVILFVPLPVVMDPFVIPHKKLAPGSELGTVAVLPVETAVTIEAATIPASGSGFTDIVLVALFVQPFPSV